MSCNSRVEHRRAFGYSFEQERWSQTSKDSNRVNNDPIEWGLLKKDGEPIISIRPAGNVTISLGGKWQRTENPAFPVNQQRTGGIDFDQQISMSLAGKIGDRITVDMNWDTKAAFDFDNNFKRFLASSIFVQSFSSALQKRAL